jgi:hypothetical protein
MNPSRSILASFALLTSAFGAPDPGVLLAPGAEEAQWRPLIDALAAKGAVQAPFTERRFFPFRREPMVLKGVLRISPDRGLSLQYTDPEASVLIADPSGLFLRTSDGRTRELPSGSRETGAIASLLPIMRFDLAALYPRFAIRARRTGPDWVFEFTPHDSDVAGSLGTISVGGTGSDVRHLEFKRSSSQRIEIEVGETRTGVLFSPDEVKRFFH